jgi:hypothetical protein
MWLNLLMDDFHLSNITKMMEKNFEPNHIGENKNKNSSKNGHIFYKMKITLLKT